MARSSPGRGTPGRAGLAASARPLLLLLLPEAQLAARLLFLGVAERAEDRGLLRSLSLGGLLVPPSWVWIRAAGRGRKVRVWVARAETRHPLVRSAEGAGTAAHTPRLCRCTREATRVPPRHRDDGLHRAYVTLTRFWKQFKKTWPRAGKQTLDKAAVP